MVKRVVSFILLLWLVFSNVVFAEIGENISQKEAAKAMQSEETKPFVIEGSVEKNIDITLKECIRFALGNNPRVKVAVEEVVASNTRIAQVWSNYFPKFNWTSSAQKTKNLLFADAISSNAAVYNYYILGSISVSQMLYDFGVTQNQATIKKLDYAGSKTSLTSVINDVICDTKKNYYNLLLAYENLKVAQDTVNKFELFYNQAKAFYEIGTNPKVDVTIAEVNLSNAKLDLIRAENNIDVATAKLNNSMGLPYITTFKVYERLNYEPLDITLEEAMVIARDSRPDLKLAEIKVATAKQNLQLSKKSYFPQLTLEGDIAVGGRSFTSNYGYTYGAFLKFPTINAMKIKNQIKEQRTLYEKELANAQNTKNNIVLEIQKAHIALVEMKSQIPVAHLGVKQAKENYELSEGRYKVGEATPTEFKDAQVSYEKAQTAYYKALYDYNSAKAELEKAIGKNLIPDRGIINLES